jgi:pimeloyl-ACP methyl ester carboxylesterase
VSTIDVDSSSVEQDHRTVVAAGLQVHVASAGSGEPVVVLHHSTGPLWSGFYDRLAEDRQVLAPDMPGYGQSERPVTARTPTHLAIILHRAFDELDLDSVDVVGLGFGGFVACEMLAMNPRRFNTLTLVGSAGLRPREGEIHDPMMESWTEYMRHSLSTDDAFVTLFGPEPAQELINLWDFSREMTARVAWKPWMWSLQLPALLQGIHTPTLVVWGSHDRVVPIDCAHQFVELLPNSRLEIVEGVGHAVDLEGPVELAGLVSGFVGSGR